MNKISLTLLGVVMFASAVPAMAEPDWQAIKLGHQHATQKVLPEKSEALKFNGPAMPQISDHDVRMASMMRHCDQMMKNKRP